MKEKFIELIRITKKLRSEDGCPWDKEQTLESLRSHIIEESYEVIEAIDLKDYENLKEELGDLLLQILLISNIAEEQNLFSLEDVIDKYKQWYYKAQEARIFANTNAEVMNFSDAEIMKKLEDNTFNSTNK